jgi:integrase
VDPKTFDSWDGAVAYCGEMLAARVRGNAPAVGTTKMTVKQFGQQWAPTQPWSAGTRNLVEGTLRNHIYPHIGDRPVVALTELELQGLITVWASQTESRATVGVRRQHLNQLLNAAVPSLRPDNPARRTKLPTAPESRLVVPSEDQVQQLIEIIDPRYRALVIIGAGLGLRQAEAIGLTRDRVDFMRRTVTISQKLRKATPAERRSNPDMPVIVMDDYTKNRQDRVVPMPDVVADELGAHIRENDIGANSLIFTSATGLPINASDWNEAVWWPARQAVGLPASQRGGFHCLRHFYATSLLRQKVSVAAVARMLGDSVKTVTEYYAHWVPQDDDLVRGVMNAILLTGADKVAPEDRSGTGSGTAEAI